MTIGIHSERPPLSILPGHVYFAFPSGALSYDCVACGSQCCRGHGYAINGERELVPQLATHAAVRFFLEPCDASSTHYHAQNLAPGCFFLNREGRCSIQIDHGFAAKPGTCRFFPFNGFRRLGSYLIVLPHSQLCPLEVVPARSSNCSNHEELLQSLAAHGIDDHVQQVVPIGLTETGLIELEQKVVRLSEGSSGGIGYSAFAALQSEATDHAMKSECGDVVERRSISGFEQLRRVMHEMLGAPASADDDPRITALLIALTPTLRAQVVFRKRGEGPSIVDLYTVPNFLMAVHSFAQLASQAGMDQITYQTVRRLVSQNHALFVLLSQVDSVVMWKPDVSVDLTFDEDRLLQQSYVEVARALLPQMQRKLGATLGDVLRPHLPLNSMQRMNFVRRVARKLVGNVTRFERSPLLNRFAHFPRASVQQLLVGAVAPRRLVGRVTRKVPSRSN